MSLILPYLQAPERLNPSRLTSQLEAMGDQVDVASLNLSVKGRESLQLRNAITGASISRTTLGASTLTLKVADPDLAILNSKWLAGSGITLISDQGGPTKTGVEFSTPVDCEIDGLWFRLLALELPTSQRELTLTFEDREVVLLRTYPKKGDPHTFKVFSPKLTRIQVMQSLIQEVKEIRQPDGKVGIRLVSPMLGATAIADASQSVDQTRRSVLHLPGFGVSSGVTVKGVPATKTQLSNLQAVLDVGVSLGVPRKLLVVAVMVVTQESTANNLLPSATGVGLFQQNPLYWPASGDPSTDANAFFQRAIVDNNANPSAGYGLLASLVQRPAAFLNGSDPTGVAYGQWQAEAENTVTAYIGDVQGTGNSNPTSPTLSPFSPGTPVIQGSALFTRGSQENQGGKTVVIRENNWACLQRLAQEVGWLCYCVSGTIYIENYEHLFQQAIRFEASPDDDAITGIGCEIDTGKQRSTVTVSARISRWGAPPGTVAAVKDLGPASGRWLVQTVERDLFSLNGEITLTKPQTTLLDAESANPIQNIQVLQPSGTTLSKAIATVGADGQGVLAAIVAAAQKAVTLQAQTNKYRYAQVRPMPSSLFEPGTLELDCSSFVTLCYKAGDAPDPNGPLYNYNGEGNTRSLIANGTLVNEPQPGDLVFLGHDPDGKPSHVVIFVGDGDCISMGTEGEPKVVPLLGELQYFGGVTDGAYTYPLGVAG